MPSGSLLVLVKLQVSVGQLDVKFATGGWLLPPGTVTLCWTECVAPWLSLTVRLTMKVPEGPYMCVALGVVTMGAPSPKLQL